MQPPIAQGNAPITRNEEAKEIQDAINTILETAQKTHEPSEKMPDSPINAPRLSRDDMDETELNSEFAWDIATKLHAKNFVRLVSRKPPVLHTIYRLLNKLQMGDWGYRVNIAEMQRMHLRALQVGLVDKAVEMQVRGNAMGPEAIAKDGKLLASLLREYTQAVQDYEYMTKVSQQPFDFFVASSERYQDSYVLDKVMRKNRVGARDFADPPRMTYESMKLHALPTGPWGSEENPEPLGGTRNASAKAVLRRNFWWKIMGAVVGGAFLVGPMWLLVLQRDLYLNLGVATAFTFAFGFLIVGCVDQLDQVFASTLAYAAVLMVFVGVMFDKQFPEGA
ncbi:uncharacterized protein CCOS01_12957 [Colletotrichum costaricense]|uniref:DUF6594 domain-containing protein n=1 Tax=Colletotrichum costaricense TaxID=1209916 RepID=A0AAJ0DVR7_9PEZI|nr:uncharacterized protein CCOS01_12957 [Colletotrichum costaricense]KAK1515759.1 hypothetical protein CCOS01_12957 [Colletotrichum costaricense]